MKKKIESEIFSIPSQFIERVKQEVVVKLGVESVYKLNDKLDGLFYLQKQLKRVLSVYIIERFTNIKLINEEKLLRTNSTIKINDFRYHVIGIDYSDKIKIPKIETDYFIIVGFLDNHKRGRVLGCISLDECIKLNKPNEQTNIVVSKEIICVITKIDLKEFVNDTTKTK